MDDVKEFFFKHYVPNNAVLVVAGNVNVSEVERLAKKWFGDIPAGNISAKNLPAEPLQTEARTLFHEANVPLKTIYMAYHTPKKDSKDQYALDLFGDILGKGQSSLIYQKLVKEQGIFSGVSAQNTSYLDSGLFIISGSLNPEIDNKEANEALENCLKEALEVQDYTDKLQKVKTQAISLDKFGETEVLNRAMKIAFAANAGDVNLCNEAIQDLESVSHEELLNTSRTFLTPENCSTMYYSPIKE